MAKYVIILRSERWKRLRNKVRREIFKAKKKHYKSRVSITQASHMYPGEWYKQTKLLAKLDNTERTIQPPLGIDVNGFEVAVYSRRIFASVSHDLDPLDIRMLPTCLLKPNHLTVK